MNPNDPFFALGGERTIIKPRLGTPTTNLFDPFAFHRTGSFPRNARNMWANASPHFFRTLQLPLKARGLPTRSHPMTARKAGQEIVVSRSC